MDEQIAKEAKKAFDKLGPEDRTGRESGRDQEQQVWREHCLPTNAKGEAQTLDADKLIVPSAACPTPLA